MKEIAAFLILLAFLIFIGLNIAGTVMTGGEKKWVFRQSPQTDICYEVRQGFSGLGLYQAMSPVDDSYCEEK